MIITQQLHSQLVLDIEQVINSLADPPVSEEWDEFGRVGNPYINDSMIHAAVDHACQNAKGWETPQDRGRFYHFLAAEIAIQLIEYRDNILLSGEPPSHRMASLNESGGLADWTFLQVCGLYTAASIIAREYKSSLRLQSRPDMVQAFKAHLDRVAKSADPPVKDLADILQVLARSHEHPDDGDLPPQKPGSGDKASKKKRTQAAMGVAAVVVVVAATVGAWLWGHSWAQPSSSESVADSPGPQRPPFPRDALAEVGMPGRPNVLLRLTGVSNGAQRWTSQSVSGKAPALPVPLDITPLAADEGRHMVIEVTLDLQLRDPDITADPGLLISASGDYPLTIKDGLDQDGERYSTTLTTPTQPNPKRADPLTSRGDDTPLALEGAGTWTFQFYVDLGDPTLYQCGYHVRSITAFAELDPKYSALVRPNSKIVDTLPVALLRTC